MTISERTHRNVKVIELQPDPIPNYDAATQHECHSSSPKLIKRPYSNSSNTGRSRLKQMLNTFEQLKPRTLESYIHESSIKQQQAQGKSEALQLQVNQLLKR
jgi:hypothetical protein